MRLALGVEAQELVGHLAHLLLRRADLVLAKVWPPRRSILGARLAAGLLLDLVQAVDGQVQLVAAGVLDDRADRR